MAKLEFSTAQWRVTHLQKSCGNMPKVKSANNPHDVTIKRSFEQEKSDMHLSCVVQV